MFHPWTLTDIEMKAIAALIEYEEPRKAAVNIGVSIDAFHDSIRRSRKKMGVKSTLLLAVKWDRWACKRSAYDVQVMAV